jgi:hypothetical protein
MAENRDVLVQAPAATRVRIKTAAVALRSPGLLHLDIIMQSSVGSVWNRSKGQLSRRRKLLLARKSAAIDGGIDEDEGDIQDDQ